MNQPDSVQRLICKGQCQCIWGAAGNCPGFMVVADLCIGRAFTDLEKFWAVQVRQGTLCSHWGALPTDTCTRMLCSYRGKSWMSACKRVLAMGVLPAPRENEESADLLPRLCCADTADWGDAETPLKASAVLDAVETEGNKRWRSGLSVPCKTYVN